MGFSCFHCGKCCDDIIVQINLTFGDIIRLSAESKKSVADLFRQEIIGFNPFFNPETEKYDIELGLNKPCKLRENQKCSLYRGRPLNCRIFPYWLISRAPECELPNILNDGFKCGEGLVIEPNLRKSYMEYADAVGEILLSESEKTDKILGIFKQRFAIPELNLGPPSRGAGIEAGRLTIAASIISKMGIGRLKEEVISAIISDPCWATLEQLDLLENNKI